MKAPLEICITIIAISLLLFALPVHADEEEPVEVTVNIDMQGVIDAVMQVLDSLLTIDSNLLDIPSQMLGLIVDSLKTSVSNINSGLLSLIEFLLTTNPNPEDMKPWWESIVLVISTFYLLLFTIIGLMFIFNSIDARKRAIAKEWLKNIFLMIIGVTISIYLYSLLLDMSTAITQFMWITGFENFFEESIFSSTGIIMTLLFGGTAFLALATLFLRYILLLIGTIVFPIGIFLYFIPPLQGWGRMIFNVIGILLFMQFIDVIIFVACNQSLLVLGSEELAQILVPSMAFLMIAGINSALLIYAIIKSVFSAGQNSTVIGFGVGILTGHVASEIRSLLPSIKKNRQGSG